MSDLIQKLVNVLIEQKPNKKPVVGKLAEWAGVEKVTGDEAGAAWKEYQATLKPAQTKKEVPGLFIKTKPGVKSFRRCGFVFSEAGIVFDLDVLSKKQIKTLKSESQLIVEDGFFVDEELVVAE